MMYSRFILRAKLLGNDGLLFDSFNKHFETITGLSELYLDSEDLFCWYKQKMISLNYGHSTSNGKPWTGVRFDLILTIRDIYINSNLNPFTKFTRNSRNTEFNISQTIPKTVPTSTRIVICYAIKRGILLSACWRVNGN